MQCEALHEDAMNEVKCTRSRRVARARLHSTSPYGVAPVGRSRQINSNADVDQVLFVHGYPDQCSDRYECTKRYPSATETLTVNGNVSSG